MFICILDRGCSFNEGAFWTEGANLMRGCSFNGIVLSGQRVLIEQGVGSHCTVFSLCTPAI